MIVKYESKYEAGFIKIGCQYDSNFKNKYVNNNDKKYLYLENNEIKGFLIVEETVEESSIILLYVDKESRRKKIGSLLLDYYIDEIKPSLKRIVLEVKSTNEAAINLYKKFDFNIIGQRLRYYADNTDAYVMERINENE